MLNTSVLPQAQFTDTKDYLVHSTSFLTREQLKAFKSLEAHNYLTSGWVLEPLGKVLPDDGIVVVGKVRGKTLLLLVTVCLLRSADSCGKCDLSKESVTFHKVAC